MHGAGKEACATEAVHTARNSTHIHIAACNTTFVCTHWPTRLDVQLWLCAQHQPHHTCCNMLHAHPQQLAVPGALPSLAPCVSLISCLPSQLACPCVSVHVPSGRRPPQSACKHQPPEHASALYICASCPRSLRDEFYEEVGDEKKREILSLGLPDDGYDYTRHLRALGPPRAGGLEAHTVMPCHYEIMLIVKSHALA